MKKNGFIMSTYVYILLVFFLLLLGTMLVVLNNTRLLANKIKENTDGNIDFNLVLKGDKEIFIVKDSEYTEPGCIATTFDGEKLVTYITNLYEDSITRASNNLKKDNTEDKNIRYYGANPNNYVRFNNELWRIIGIFGNNVKLIRSEKIGNLSWDSSESSINSGWGVNEWSQSDLKNYLNTMYYGGAEVTCYGGRNNTTTTCPTNKLDDASKSLIDNHTWNTGAIDGTDATISNQETFALNTVPFYNAERGSVNGKICSSGIACNDTVERTTTWTGYVGLPYPTDWAYASSESVCETNMQTKDDSNVYICKNNNWMQRSAWTWYLSPGVQSANANYVWTVSGNGNVANYIMFGAMSKFAYYGSNVAPSIYLKSSVLMKGGTGTSSDPYKLA